MIEPADDMTLLLFAIISSIYIEHNYVNKKETKLEYLSAIKAFDKFSLYNCIYTLH